MKALAFVVPGAPVPCARARVVGRRAYTPPKTEAYEQLVAYHAMAAMGRARWRPSRPGPFAVELRVHRAALRGDADNYAKAALDAMTRVGIWDDDRHVEKLDVWLLLDRENPRLEVKVEVLDRRENEGKVTR
jgi:Holliday junction resolvase RusA-like endonuclease